MTETTSGEGSAASTSQAGAQPKPRVFLVSCPYVFHSANKPITYLFAVNSDCPPEALQYENWGLVERVDSVETDIQQGGPGMARRALDSHASGREWRIAVGNRTGPIFQERIAEGGWDENQLKEALRRIPSCVLLIQEILVGAFATACEMAHVSHTVHRHDDPLCADCVRFGCAGPEACHQRKPDEKESIEDGRKFRLA